MEKVRIRELRENIGGAVSTVLSIFLADSNFGPDEFDGTVSGILSKSNLFERLHIVGFKEDVRRILAWLQPEEDSGVRVRKVLRDFEASVTCIVFDSSAGGYRALEPDLATERVGGAAIIDAERRASLLFEFDVANGMMCAPQGVHYAKTSTAHSERFIRASNVLEDDLNVAQVAFWMVGHIWDPAIDQVVVDTSGIYAAAILAAHHRSKLQGVALARVWTHRSFDGLRSLDAVPTSAACVISATTSGTLARLLFKKGAPSQRVLTIYGLMPSGDSDQKFLCDLSIPPSSGLGGHALIENQDEKTCRYCNAGSLPVRISGDQFVLEPPQIREVDIVVGDISDQVRATIGEIVGTGLFKVFRHRLGRRGGNHEIFLDVNALFSYLRIPLAPLLRPEGGDSRLTGLKKGLGRAIRAFRADGENTPGAFAEENTADFSVFWNKFRQSWRTLQNRSLTFNVRRVVCASHPFSRELAEDTCAKFPAGSVDVPGVYGAAELSQLNGIPQSGTIVVSACLEDQQELMAIKRDLRDIQKYGTTWFLLPILRGATSDTAEQVRKLIGYGEFGPGTFSAHHCLHLTLPECRPQTTWDVELNTLGEIRDWLILQGAPVPAELKVREDALRAAARQGMAAGLFWPSPLGVELALRNDFTLAPSSKAFSQADIYCAISIYLHSLRAVGAGEKRLLHTAFARSVLSPNVFTKFNDGVLQAAILRAARDHELHYGNSTSASATMRDILLNEVREMQFGRGEALMEFVLALVEGRMTLLPGDVVEFGRALDSSTAAPAPLRAAAQFLVEIHRA